MSRSWAILWLLAALAACSATPDESRAPRESLMDAIRSGDEVRVEAVAREGVDLEALREGERPLHLAVRLGRVGVVDALLRLGADPGSRGPTGKTALHLAAAEGDAAIVRALIAAGARVDARDSLGDQPLHLSASKASDEVLITAGAPLEALGSKGLAAIDCLHERGRRATRAMLQAISRGSFEEVEGRLEEGADPRAHDAAGHSALCLLLFARGRIWLRVDEGGRERRLELGMEEVAGQRGIEIGSGRVAGLVWEPGSAAEAGLAALELLLRAGADPEEAIPTTGLWVLFPGMPADMSAFQSTGVVQASPAQFARAIGQEDALELLNRAAGR